MSRQFCRQMSTGGASDDDLQRWEQMYAEGEEQKKAMVEDEDNVMRASVASEVRVVTFDLDNTLWKTGPTIAAANDALAEFLDSKGINQPKRVEVYMGELFKANKAKYCPIDGDDATAPVNLTQLRKDAITELLQTFNKDLSEDFDDIISEAFDVWRDTRHNTIPDFFATSVIETLREIRQMESSSGRPVLMGAVTDGNSEPRDVPGLSPFFDFCVNAEEVGVSKPNTKVYLTAIQRAARHPFISDLLSGSMSEDAMEDSMGPWWVHIGDDFTKDIVAAKTMGMRTIYAKELVMDKLPPAPPAPKKPTRSAEDLMKEIADKPVINMSIGSDDYLADSIFADFVDSEIVRFDEIASTLNRWHNEALKLKNTETAVEAIEPKAVSAPTPLAAVADDSENEASPVGDSKFCMSCGTKLPKAAKFCSNCGAKQP